MKSSRSIVLLFMALLPIGFTARISSSRGTIDRKELVRRHFPKLSEENPLSPFTVGNGKFAFTADVTGLQTFPEFYETGIPLTTQSEWGWHSVPNPQGYAADDATQYWDVDGRRVPYLSLQNTAAGQYLRSNPHRLNLGRVGFQLQDSAGDEIGIGDIDDLNQVVDLWQGVIRSSYRIDGKRVDVETACHPDMDQISARIHSALLQTGRMSIRFAFPYGSLGWGKDPGDWTQPDRHSSEIVAQTENSAIIRRTLDADHYYVAIHWTGNADFSEIAKHTFLLTAEDTNHLDLNVLFSPDRPEDISTSAEETLKAAGAHWESFWTTGGAVDLSRSRDVRAGELERRIILSRYLTAIQCAGSFPPAETGLTCNSWYGKFHLEMHWWHSVHFALWGNQSVLENSLPWYRSILPEAKKTAGKQGYDGVRWPKMVAPQGREGPSSVGVFLIWQQPHPIYYSELLYRLTQDKTVLERYQDIVFQTAAFMASYARWDDDSGCYVLGPPLIPAQEIYGPGETRNPSFELSYWKYGLETAQEWRERLGLPRSKRWDDVLSHLARLSENNGLYQNAEIAPDTFEKAEQRRDHPMLLGSLGMLNDESVNVEKMRATLEKVLESWDWQTTWGWDYPLMAMTAARVGCPELAIRALMLDVPKNTYLNNGHNYQNDRLPVYLPGNGGLLAAVAMMAAGWEGGPDIEAPGFPRDGNWTVQYENIYPMP